MKHVLESSYGSDDMWTIVIFDDVTNTIEVKRVLEGFAK